MSDATPSGQVGRRELLVAGVAALSSVLGGCASRHGAGPSSADPAPRPVDHAALGRAVRAGDRGAYVSAAGSPGAAVYDAITACRPVGYRIVGAGSGFREQLTLRLATGRRVTFASPLTAFGTGDAFWRTWGSPVTRTDGRFVSVLSSGPDARGWATALDSAAEAVARVLGAEASGFAALVAPTDASFASLTGFAAKEGIVAACVTTLTDAHQAVIVIAPGLEANGAAARSVLAHELTHLELSPDGRSDRCPPWLAEGLADWVAVAVVGDRRSADRATQRALRAGGGLPSASEFGSTHVRVRESAYLRAYAAADALVAEWGLQIGRAHV